jgi:hypothetical protein
MSYNYFRKTTDAGICVALLTGKEEATMNHNNAWYFDRAEKRIGPISNETLERMLTAGEIDPRQVVWQQTPEQKFYVRAEQALATPAEIH